MNAKKRKRFIIEYLRIYLFISVFTPGLYLAIRAHESVFLYLITVIAIISGAGTIIKLAEIMEDTSGSKMV